jgi:hypothetical protein
MVELVFTLWWNTVRKSLVSHERVFHFMREPTVSQIRYRVQAGRSSCLEVVVLTFLFAKILFKRYLQSGSQRRVTSETLVPARYLRHC